MAENDLKAALLADRTMLRVSQEPNVETAYEKFLAETLISSKGLSLSQKTTFAGTLPLVSNEQVKDLSLPYALANFQTLDQNDNGSLELSELSSRRTSLAGRKLESESLPGLSTAMEGSFLASLVDRHSYLRSATKTGSWWNLNLVDPPGITRQDLRAAIKDTHRLRTIFASPPLLPEVKGDADLRDLPGGVPEIFESAGVEVKTLDQPVDKALASHIEQAPIIAIAAALYNPSTREIFVERGQSARKAKLHEVGHAVDDALVPGSKFFSESSEFNREVDLDLQNLNNLSPKPDWSKALPTVHFFIQSGLQAGRLNEGARKELFAELYQSGDVNLAAGLRNYFPRTGLLVDETLRKNGIGR